MLTLRTDINQWEINELTNIRSADFQVVLSFTNRNHDKFIFPIISDKNEIWQVGKNEFVILSAYELFHIMLSYEKGVETLFRANANSVKTLFGRNFFYFKDGAETSHIYSVLDHLEIADIIKKLIDPMVRVVIEESLMMIRVEAPYLTAHFALRGPEDNPTFMLPDCVVLETGRPPGSPLLCLRLCDATNQAAKNFTSFAKLAKERCEEVRIAEYYEKCGGYYLGDGSKACGIFTEKETPHGDIYYEHSPDDFYMQVALNKLLETNGLRMAVPDSKCTFLGKMVDDEDYTIELSRDILIINDHTYNTERFYALEMYGESCIGICRTGKDTFLALIEETQVGLSSSSLVSLRYVVHSSVDRYDWDYAAYRLGLMSYVDPLHCQLTEDIIVFTADPECECTIHPSFQMWSISKNRLVDVVDGFTGLKINTPEPYISHKEWQILVKPSNGASNSPKLLIVARLFVPREHCDLFALIDPANKYQVYGKIYNMLADSMIKRSPKTIRGLVKVFSQNQTLKQVVMAQMEKIPL